jgi:hypothetical protein
VLVRLEMLAPFPHDRLTSVLREYPNADVVWCQVRSLKTYAPPSQGWELLGMILPQPASGEHGGLHERTRANIRNHLADGRQQESHMRRTHTGVKVISHTVRSVSRTLSALSATMRAGGAQEHGGVDICAAAHQHSHPPYV